jgi:hypothetical protein
MRLDCDGGGAVAVGDVRLEGSDAAELAEMLSFLREWLCGPDRPALTESLVRFVGMHGYDVGVLCADLARFVFLLGGDDGELLFDGKTTE